MTAGTALVTVTEVAALTHEDGLSRLDGDTPASGATLANAVITATDHLILLLEGRGLRPDRIGNPTHSALRLAAAHLAAYVCLAGTADEDSQARAKVLYERAQKFVAAYPFQDLDAGIDQKVIPGLPIVVQRDRYATFRRSDFGGSDFGCPPAGFLQRG